MADTPEGFATIPMNPVQAGKMDKQEPHEVHQGEVSSPVPKEE